MAFLKGRIDFALRLLATFLVTLAPIYVFVLIRELTVWHFVLPFLFAPIIIAALFPIEFQRTIDAKLVLNKPLWSPVATVHLKEHYQRFDRDTYLELIELVKLLPNKGVTKITMASPMFYYPNGELRSFRLLEKQLSYHNAKLSHSPAPWFGCIIGKISMLLNKPDANSTINLRQWHIMTIDLENKNDQANSTSPRVYL
ncbi:hypothetical protein TUM4438_40470 [Shewanella sairae]|uniref:Uncharacterized protein n=2 Tax=Shewanella sairae TaxID=190310 RepID=A0ABQ4PQD1_9GAMM|nr:hypothetical protein TUM4438_40470 [Shewanella sairae]